MAESISYIKVGNQNHPIDAVTVNGLSFTSEEKTRWNNKQDALTFDSIPTENSDNLVKSGSLYTVLTDTELVVATALNDLNERILSVDSSISEVYDEIDRALTAVLTYRGTVGSNGDVSVLPSSHEVGDVYVVSVAGTYAGQACEVGDYIICKTSGTSASDAHWNVVNGENQVSNSAASLAAPGSSVTIATVDGTNITISTPSTWTGVSKNGTLTGVTFNGVSASVSNGVASISAPVDIELIDVGVINSFSNASFPSGTFNTANQAIKDGKTVIIRTSDGEYYNDWHTVVGGEDDSITLFNENYNETILLESDDTVSSNDGAGFVRASQFTFDSIPTENSDNLVKSGVLYKVITDNEYVAAAAINDLNDRLEETNTSISSLESSISAMNSVLVFDSIPTENSENLVNSGDLYDVIVSNERVVATAFNDVNDRLMVLENTFSGAITGITVNGSSVAVSDGIASISISGGTGGGITGVTFNGVSASVSNGVASITTEENKVEIIELSSTSLNTLSNAPSGTFQRAYAAYSAGKTVILRYNINDSFYGNYIYDYILSYDGTINDEYLCFYDSYKNRSVELWNNDNISTRQYDVIQVNGTAITPQYARGAINISVPAEVTEATVSGWGFTKNTGTLTTHASHKLTTTNSTATSVNQGTEITFIESLTGTTTATSGDLTVTATRKKVTIPTAVTESTVTGWGFTKNAGTLTGVKFNGTSASVSNGVASITATIPTVNDSTITIQKNGTNVDSFTTNASSNKSINITVNELPEVTSNDVDQIFGGKILVATFDTTNGYRWEKTSNLTLYHNGQIAVHGSAGTTYLDTGGIFRTDRSSWDWIRTGTGGTYRSLQSDLDAIRQLPAVSSSQNGQVLQVVNGQWTLVTPVSIYSGSSNPDNSQGTNGDIYLQTS